MRAGLRPQGIPFEQVDPSIVGGLVLEARGERRDISVKTQLRIAQETLANSANSYGGEA